jgi:hypothetical protein
VSELTDYLKQEELAKLRRFEALIHREFTGEELERLAPDLRGISDEIKKIELGIVWFVVGPEGKIFRCEDTRAATLGD